MNKRIKDLLSKDLLTICGMPNEDSMDIYSDPRNKMFYMQQFAELIIQECINVVIDCDESPKMILHEPYRTIVNRIEEHFGIVFATG